MAFSTSQGVVKLPLVCPVCGEPVPVPPMQPGITDTTVVAVCKNNHSTTTEAYIQLSATGAELNASSATTVSGATTKVKVLPFTTTADTNAVSTGFAFPAKAILHDVWIDCTTADSGKTLSVGNNAGSANEFLVTITIGTTGVKLSSLVSGSVTLGASLIETVTGSGSATHSARKYASVGGLTVAYKTSAAATTAGNIYLRYTELA